jgi:hypothetical protein
MVGASGDPRVLGVGQAATPFTAEEIREGCPEGRTTRIRVEVAGEAAFVRVSRYVECDAAGAVMERWQLALDGAPLGQPEVERVTWGELQAHASFPAEQTTAEAERIETAIGVLDCLRYTVRDGMTEQVFWFAKELPGMPIQFLTRTNGEVVTTVSVVDDTMVSG